MSDQPPVIEGQILIGPLFRKPMRVETIKLAGAGGWVLGLVGATSEQFRKVTLTPADLASLKILDTANLAFQWQREPKEKFDEKFIAMKVVLDYERAQGRQMHDVHERNLGYDITSLDLNSGELRLIEVKGLSDATGTIVLTPNERRVAEDRRDCYWLYVVGHCGTTPQHQDRIKDPDRFPWHEVTKVQHYWLGVDALSACDAQAGMTQPMEVREDPRPYGKGAR